MGIRTILFSANEFNVWSREPGCEAIELVLQLFQKKSGVGSLSVCGAYVFHRWRPESLPIDPLRVYDSKMRWASSHAGKGFCQADWFPAGADPCCPPPTGSLCQGVAISTRIELLVVERMTFGCVVDPLTQCTGSYNQG